MCDLLKCAFNLPVTLGSDPFCCLLLLADLHAVFAVGVVKDGTGLFECLTRFPVCCCTLVSVRFLKALDLGGVIDLAKLHSACC